jgi:hypothetical protein
MVYAPSSGDVVSAPAFALFDAFGKGESASSLALRAAAFFTVQL